MERGAAWSGGEPKASFVNLGDGRFAAASAVAGLDFTDDGRALAAVDWDEDGDVDLWFRNRSGPQLRFVQNQGPPQGHFVELRLEGRHCNRDAIGAQVELAAGADRFVRSVAAGDGYLSQSSKRLVFGLGRHDRIDRVTVRWPGGGREELHDVEVDRRYRVVQGSGRAEPVSSRGIHLAAIPAPPAPPATLTSVVLQVPLLLPPTMTRLLEAGSAPGVARLLIFWEPDCAPCLAAIEDLARRRDELEAAALSLVVLALDDVAQAERWFAERIAPHLGGSASWLQRPATREELEIAEALVAHVLRRHDALQPATSLLVDAKGSVQVVYLGQVGADRLLEDIRDYVRSPVPPFRRGPAPGRWYYETARPLTELATDLKERGMREDARFYLALDVVGRQGHAPSAD
jgi:hypothetical protein